MFLQARLRVEIFSARRYALTMRITVQLPDDLAQRPNPGRETLESLAIEGYRSGMFSYFQASQILGLSRFEFEGFLKERHVHEQAYDVGDFKQDRETLRQLPAKGLLRA
jgi:predicted HTH domain antitoxin